MEASEELKCIESKETHYIGDLIVLDFSSSGVAFHEHIKICVYDDIRALRMPNNEAWLERIQR